MIEGKRKVIKKKEEEENVKNENMKKKRKKITFLNNIDIFNKMPNYIRSTTFRMYTSGNFVDEEQNIDC